jgi:hypothetical protein
MTQWRRKPRLKNDSSALGIGKYKERNQMIQKQKA